MSDGRLLRHGGPTRLDRAITLLKSASVGRPYVLIIEKAHGDSDRSATILHKGTNMASWQVMGLLKAGMMQEERTYMGGHFTGPGEPTEST